MHHYAPSALCSAHHTQRNRPKRPKVAQFVSMRGAVAEGVLDAEMVELLLLLVVNLLYRVPYEPPNVAHIVLPCCMRVVLECWGSCLFLFSLECGLSLSHLFLFCVTPMPWHPQSASLSFLRFCRHVHAYMSISCRSRINESFSTVVKMLAFRLFGFVSLFLRGGYVFHLL